MAIQYCEDLLEVATDQTTELWALETIVSALYEAKEFEKAMEFAKRLQDNTLSDKVSATQNIAEILKELDQADKSIEILNELVLENPENIDLKKSLSRAYQAKKDFVTAIATYKKILDEVDAHMIPKIHSEISLIYIDWAMYLYKEGDTAECFKKFTSALQYDSDNPSLYFKLGVINIDIKNFNEAIGQFKKAIERDPFNGEYFYELSKCYAGIQNIYEQKKALLECVKYTPENAEAHYELGMIAKSQNDRVTAFSSFEKTLELRPDSIDAKYELALLLELQGRVEEAVNLYEQILEVDPEFKEVASNLKLLKGQD